MSTLLLRQKWESFSLIQKLSATAAMIQLWIERHHQRKLMALLDADQLVDMGLSAKQAQQEIKKPFWK